MTGIAHVTAFFEQRLPVERGASQHTRASYAYAFKLLLTYASRRHTVAPSQLALEQIDAPLVVDFLNDLETTRGNGPGSRNARLAAIKSFMHFMEYRVPSALEQIQRILAIPVKRRPPGLSGTSMPRRCNRSWMPLTQLSGTASVTERCFTFVLRVDCVSLSWWDSGWRTCFFTRKPAF